MQNLMYDLLPRNITELVQRTLSLLVLNDFVCLVESNTTYYHNFFFSACDLQRFVHYLYVYT